MARTQGHGNPKWTWDETILALDLYFDCKQNVPASNDARVQELSVLLRSLPYHSVVAKRESFRNADGVAFKLQNLRQVATGRGLGNVSQTDKRVWSEFGGKPREVRELAKLIRSGVKATDSLESASDDEDEEFLEGKVLTALHTKKERNRKIRKALIEGRRKGGPLACDLCGKGSTSLNPRIEDAMFEAHHRVPISVSVERKTRVSEMALVCANCHRLLHRAISVLKRWVDIEEGREFIGVRQEKTERA